MSDEKKIDLSSLDGIADRVARAKAKAEAMRAAKAAGGAHPPAAPAAPPAETPTAARETPAPAGPQEAAAPAEAGKADLSNLDAITDRVARAKAKAEAMRAAKAAGGAHPAPAAPKKAAPAGAEPRPRREVSAEAMAAKKAQAKTRAEAAAPAAVPPGGNGATFCAGMTIRRNGKLAKILATSYENVCLVYEDAPREKVMTKRYRLAVELQRGALQVASAHDFKADIPPSAGRFGRAVAFLAAAGLTGIVFLGLGLLIGPLNLFPTLLIGYVLFALAHHLTR
jgi:hypothetical protein